jgi:SAM-dependent methyltransferase
MTLRTDDISYGKHYWQSLDDGAGYNDSTLHEDLSYLVKETFGIDRRTPDKWTDISGNVNVVDVGCAMGYLVKHLRARGHDAWGLDVSRYALEHADPDAKEYLRLFDLTREDESFFGKDKFRLVTCFETLEHIPEVYTDRALKHIYDLLEHGGRACLTICTSGQPGWDTDPTHVTIKSHSWWDAKLQENGFHETQADDWAWCFLRTHWLFSQHDGVFVVTK